MHEYEVYVKQIMLSGKMSADEYNAHILMGVKHGWLKDITPRTYVMDTSAKQVVGAYIQFPDGDVFHIQFFDKSDRENHKIDYDCKIERANMLFAGGLNGG